MSEHEVHFDIYCPRCLDWGTSEWKEPCDRCLSTPVNEDSRRPLYFRQDPDKPEVTQEDIENAHQ